MKTLKITTQAVTASFRYPHVQIGKLPTYEVPPPATIFGHLAGVLGEWFDPDGLEFAYVFEHKGKGVDVETGQPIERGTGKYALKSRGWNFPVNVFCQPNPQRREFLYRPQLKLYLKGPEALLTQLSIAFLNPSYAYVLGRSQDLATCIEVRWVELAESDEGFFSHTILPYTWRPFVSPGTTVQLARTIDYRKQRAPDFQVYLQVLWPPLKLYPGSQDTIARDQLPPAFWIDSEEQRQFPGRTLCRGLYFHHLASASTA
ncbi:MAG TPA: type I-B CRISPR-associated protein Cas5b [Terriglobales bacterium]|nr:type I-B CRISPR-associated protein Cas5b [Terriglobales bacterium]